MLLCAPEGEKHVVGLLMAADLLEDAGYNVLLAGEDVSRDALGEMLDHHRPALVGLTATMPETAKSMRASIVRTLDGVADVVSAADGLLRRAGVN